MYNLLKKSFLLALLLALGLSSPNWVESISNGPVQPLHNFYAPHNPPLKTIIFNNKLNRFQKKIKPAQITPRHLWRTFKNSV